MTNREELYQVVGALTDEACRAMLDFHAGKANVAVATPVVYTADEICKLVKCSRTTLWRIGAKPCYFVGNRPRFRLEDVQALLGGVRNERR